MPQSTDESDLRHQVRAWLDVGLDVPEVERRLQEKGLDKDYAASLVNAVLAGKVAESAASERRRARLPFWGGIALCAGGISLMVLGVLAFVRPELKLPAHVGVFALGAGAVGAGVMLLVRALG